MKRFYHYYVSKFYFLLFRLSELQENDESKETSFQKKCIRLTFLFVTQSSIDKQQSYYEYFLNSATLQAITFSK
ncbi:hypothetical protein CYL31_04505 [Marinomonas sp. A3A]|nr:hypothetical protein CYL31_04505 [Marinomonas sp. A3A]